MRAAGCLVAALAVTAALAGPARAAGPADGAASAGSLGMQILDVPRAASEDPRARLYIVDHLAPGTVIHRRVKVTNTGDSAVHVGMYAAGATIAKGAFLGSAGHMRNELSTWTTVRPRVSDVRAHGSLTATVTIAVPRDAAPGERYGVVWAETRSDPGAEGGITEVSRVGVRLYLSVGPGGAPAANFTINSVSAGRSEDGRPTVLATVRNTGGRALDISGALRLVAGPGGLKAGPFPANLGTTLAIGATEPITIALDRRVPDGPWDARVTLRSGLLERSARETITFPATGSSSRLLPAIAGLVALLLLAIAAQRIMRRRRRRRSGDVRSDRPPKPLAH